MPGTFCEAIVTRYSGKAMPMMAAGEKCGVTRTGCGDSGPSALAEMWLVRLMSTTATTTAAGTANSFLKQDTTAQVSTMARPRAGCVCTARAGARQSGSKIPASMALASGLGIDETRRPSGFHRPESTMRAPVTTNAPTAEGKPPCGAAESASSAAPGVDQAMLIGIRYRKLRTIPHTPIEIEMAIRPDAACERVAPTLASPSSTIAKLLENPTNAAIKPALEA